MKNKKKFIFITVIALIILIPLVTLAAMKLVNIPIMDNNAIAEANQKETERLLLEKQQYEKNNTDNLNRQTKNINSQFSQEEQEKFLAEKQEIEDKEKKIKEIMNRYYPEEFNSILNDIETSTTNRSYRYQNYNYLSC